MLAAFESLLFSSALAAVLLLVETFVLRSRTCDTSLEIRLYHWCEASRLFLRGDKGVPIVGVSLSGLSGRGWWIDHPIPYRLKLPTFHRLDRRVRRVWPCCCRCQRGRQSVVGSVKCTPFCDDDQRGPALLCAGLKARIKRRKFCVSCRRGSSDGDDLFRISIVQRSGTCTSVGFLISPRMEL